MARYRWQFPASAGILIRGKVVADIKARARFFDVDLEIDEDRGWFSSYYVFTAEGEGDDMEKFRAWVAKYSKWLDS